jgi:hypothetical protein
MPDTVWVLRLVASLVGSLKNQHQPNQKWPLLLENRCMRQKYASGTIRQNLAKMEQATAAGQRGERRHALQNEDEVASARFEWLNSEAAAAPFTT